MVGALREKVVDPRHCDFIRLLVIGGPVSDNHLIPVSQGGHSQGVHPRPRGGGQIPKELAPAGWPMT